MNILLIISSNDPEITWNAVRFGNFLLNEGGDVNIFLNGPGVTLYDGDSEMFPIREQTKTFCLSEGVLCACGKCMDIHGMNADEYVKRSNMKELHSMVAAADKIISY